MRLLYLHLLESSVVCFSLVNYLIDSQKEMQSYFLYSNNKRFENIILYFIGACLARCSQPEVGWLGWRSTNDENLVKAILDSCLFDRASGSNKKIFKSNSTKLPSESESNSSHPSSSLSTLSNEKVSIFNFETIFENIINIKT